MPAPAPSESAVAAAVETPGASSPAAPAAATPEWPQWRGPNRDGAVVGASAPAAWPKELKEQWRVTVGVGHSSPVVSGGRVYQFARRGEEEVLVALDAATGKELWKAAGLAAPYEMDPAARDHGKGPKSTPVVRSRNVSNPIASLCISRK